MMNLQLLAHADEFHTDSTSQAEHIFTEWWFGLIAYGLVVFLLLWLLRKILSFAARVTLLLGVSLVVGLLFYRWTPLLSGVALVVGFGLALMLGLGAAKKN